MDTSALPAANGRLAGGLVTIVTRSGGNDYHGDAFEFVRNGDFNARNFFSPKQDTLKRNQFGGTFGGKIIKNKLFFFAGYQGTRLVSVPGSSIAFVPTPLELAGNFTVQESAACQSSGKSKTLTGFAGNLIPVTQFDPAALKLVPLLAPAASPCGQTSYAVRNVQNEDQGIGRLDWVQSHRNNVFLRYFNTKYVSPAPFSATNLITTQSPGLNEGAQSITIGDNFTLSSSMLSSLHLTVTRRTDFRAPSADMINAKTLGINIYTAVSNDFRLSVSNDFNIGCGTCSPGYFNTTSFELNEGIDWIRGIHHISFGGQLIRTDENLRAGFLQNGFFSFSGSVTGDPMGDFLIGAMSGYQQGLAQQPNPRKTIPGLFLADTIHLNSRLTINAGIRWEPSLYPHDAWHRGGTFSIANFLAGTTSSIYPGAPAGTLFYGDPGVSSTFTQNHWANLSPRLGLAWDPNGNGKQTLRVGGALLYDSAEAFAAQTNAANPPFSNQVTLTTSKPGGLSNPWTTGYNYAGGNPFPPRGAYFPAAAAWLFIQPNLKPASVAQWNISYQRQFGADWVVSASYIGNKTSNLWIGSELDPALNSPAVCAQSSTGCTTANTNQRKLFVQLIPAVGKYYGNVDQISSAANADYNALLVSANHRLTRGISVLVNFTQSHCISQGDFGNSIAGPTYENPANRAQDRGNCNFDIGRIFNASVIGTTPSKEGNRIIRSLTGNWQISPLFRITNGAPLNVLTGADNSLTGIGLDRPNYVAGKDPYYTGSNRLQYLDPAAFTANLPGTFGNLGRDALRGPKSLNIDLALTRLIPVGERYRLEVRGEAFNLINHTNFLAPSTGTGIPNISTSGISLTQNSPSFGRITSAGDPRILQVAMKLYF